MIWRMATPSAEDRHTQYGTPYKWSDYVHKLTSIILSRHEEAKRIICGNDPYDTMYSTKDDERALRVQGKAHVPNTYMKLGDPFPSAGAFKSMLCSSSNKRPLQAMICSYLTDVAPQIIYSNQPNNKCKTTALISLRLPLYCSPFMDFCASQVAVTQLLLMQLILMPMFRQRSFCNRCPVSFVSRERRVWFLVKTW